MGFGFGRGRGRGGFKPKNKTKPITKQKETMKKKVEEMRVEWKKYEAGIME